MTSILRRRPAEDEKIVEDVFSDNFDSVMKKTIGRLVMSLVSTALAYCTSKYTEEYYHQRMREGFSYIEDWRVNHTDKFNTFIKRARRVRGFLTMDEYKILAKVEVMLNNRGWQMYPSEKEQVLKDIQAIKMLIYDS